MVDALREVIYTMTWLPHFEAAQDLSNTKKNVLETFVRDLTCLLVIFQMERLAFSLGLSLPQMGTLEASSGHEHHEHHHEHEHEHEHERKFMEHGIHKMIDFGETLDEKPSCKGDHPRMSPLIVFAGVCCLVVITVIMALKVNSN